ncbi:MAG TPA: hypothetical protein VJS67_15880 [Pseudonocardiaceae bacterium]|nr:hypothetical protein [Pseudonocardiaceae bacterium]
MLDELAEQLGPPDQHMVAEAVQDLTVLVHRVRTADMMPARPEAPVLAVLDSAFIAATALVASPAVIPVGDPDDLSRLVGDNPVGHVRPLP